MNLLTIKTFDNSIDTHILRVKLESEGIPCFIFDENTVSINPLYNLTVGGIKLKVKTEDFERAKLIIEETELNPITSDDGEIVTCPNCGAKDIYFGFKSMKDVKGVLSIIVSFIFAIYPIYYNTVNKCKVCDEEWI